MSEGKPPVAVVGLACRAPGADDYEQLWRNLVDGVESVRRGTREELLAAGVDPADFDQADYVPVTAAATELDAFDAGLFGLTPREAEIHDPQHRLFLECVYGALTDAGYDPMRLAGPVGLFGGSAPSDYAEHYVRANHTVTQAVGEMTVSVSNDMDYLTTYASYRLGFTGPSVAVQTACSTALVAVHLACQSLRAGECTVAVAGGVAAQPPWDHGYWFEEGSILSRTGHVRPFDSEADGTIFSAGGGAIALKLLSDAIRDGDHVYAVVRGSAVNNDGLARAGFTAPGPDGQAVLISRALADAGVDAGQIGFVEAHGTGTLIGDPIEVTALTRAFREHTDRVGYCAIGSVKGNVGHLGAGAGVVGLIKAALGLDRQAVPASINYEKPNPAIALDSSPFFVNTSTMPWPRGGAPRLAAVSSFGIGGTNAHLLLEEAPTRVPAGPARHRVQLLPMSARSEAALARGCARLASYLDDHEDLDLAEVARTLQEGRGEFPFRRAVVAGDVASAAAALRVQKPPQVHADRAPAPRVAWLFPGQGAQYAGMGAGLYADEPVYRTAIDRCAELLKPELGLDLRELLLASGPDADARLAQTAITQPAVFAVEWALGELWASLSAPPAVMLGHSVGEYVAATRAGVFRLEDALRLVAARGRLMQSCEPGSMLAVPVSRDEAMGLVRGRVSIAASNSPRLTVLTGPTDELDALAEELSGRGVDGRRLVTSHAFHSCLVEPVLEPFTELVAGVDRQPPALPYLSNVTGDWVSAGQVADPAYWAEHLRSEVRFSAGLQRLLAQDDLVFIEVGPGRTLAGLVRDHAAEGEAPRNCVASLRHPKQVADDLTMLLSSLGSLWTEGLPVDWEQVRGPARRVPLPGYPYERRRHWVDADRRTTPTAAPTVEESNDPMVAPFYLPTWTERPIRARRRPTGETWLVLAELDDPFGAALVDAARAAGVTAVVADAGYAFHEGDENFTVDPESPEDHLALLDALADTGRWPDRIIHAFSPASDVTGGPTDPVRLDRDVRRGFLSLLALFQAIGRRTQTDRCRLLAVTSTMQPTLGTEDLAPGQASVLGAVLTTDKEFPQVVSRSIDIVLPETTPAEAARSVVAEAALDVGDMQVALRRRRRWVLDYAPVDQVPGGDPGLRPGGVYLISGGLGDIGLEIAHDFARLVKPKLALLARRQLPPRDEWAAEISAGGPHAPTLRRLLEIEAAGAELSIHAVDVADRAAVADAVTAVRERFGALHGVVHAAGLAGGGMMAVRRRADAEAVLAAKVQGTAALLDACGDDLDFFAGFSSLIAITADLGQADYCAANCVLDRFAHRAAAAQAGSRAGHVTHHVAIDWVGWSGMGMLKRVDELRERDETRTPVDHPVLRTFDRDGDRARATLRLEPEWWPVSEHRFGDDHVAPATLYLETVRAALELATGEPAVEIEDAVFSDVVVVREPVDCEIELNLQDDGWWRFTFSESGIPGDDGARAFGRIRPNRQPAPPPVDLAEFRARCPEPDDLPERDMILGAHWHSLLSVHRDAGYTSSIIELALPAGLDSDVDDYWLHPAQLDHAASTATPDLIYGHLPFSYRRLVVHAPIPARCLAWRAHRRTEGDDDEWLHNDLLIVDRQGTVCVEVEEFVLRRIDAVVDSLVDGTTGDNAARKPSDILDEFFKYGTMSPEQGVELFRRILASRPGPQVTICPGGLEPRLAMAEETHRDALMADLLSDTVNASFERGLSTPLVAPETELEEFLASLWSGALGVREIGVEDDFFELGGSSLVAVQVLARIRERLDLDVPIAIVFETSTIRQLAAELEKQLVELVAGMSDEAVADALEARP